MDHQNLKGAVQGIGCLGVIVIIAIAAAGGFAGKKAEVVDPDETAIRDARYGAETMVEQQLRDPSSAEFSEVAVYIHPDGGFVACGFVNSRNAFGGMSGRKPFVGNSNFAVIGEGENETAIQMAWSKLCVNPAENQP